MYAIYDFDGNFLYMVDTQEEAATESELVNGQFEEVVGNYYKEKL